MKLRPPYIYGALAAASLAMLSYGLYAQYVQKFEPCPICYFQRMVIGLLGIAWLINAFFRRALRAQVTLQLLLCSTGAALALRHLWIQTHPDVAKGSCGMGIQYMLDSYPFLEVLLKSWKGTVDCTDASWRILGLTAPVWLTLLFAGAAGITFMSYRLARRTAHHSV